MGTDCNCLFQDHHISVVANSSGTVVHAFKADGVQEIQYLCPEDPTWLLIKKVYDLYNWRWRYKVPLFEMYPAEVRQHLNDKWRKQTRRLHEAINPSKRISSFRTKNTIFYHFSKSQNVHFVLIAFTVRFAIMANFIGGGDRVNEVDAWSSTNT